MRSIILEIRERLDVSQEKLAKLIGIPFATVNRWENGHSSPNKAAQLRLYDVCKNQKVDLETIIDSRIKSVSAELHPRTDRSSVPWFQIRYQRGYCTYQLKPV